MSRSIQSPSLLHPKVYTHTGPWGPHTRSSTTLAFLEKYTAAIKSCSFSNIYHAWYAPSAVFYDTESTDYVGGEKIYEWIKELFAPFEEIEEGGNERTVRVFEGDVLVEKGVGVVAEGFEPESGVVAAEKQKADLVIYEHIMIFHLRGDRLRGDRLRRDGIPAKRMMEFVVGKSEVEGQGTDGMQIWRGKVWWDKSGFMKNVDKRSGL